jgi:hypothetical protein
MLPSPPRRLSPCHRTHFFPPPSPFLFPTQDSTSSHSPPPSTPQAWQRRLPCVGDDSVVLSPYASHPRRCEVPRCFLLRAVVPCGRLGSGIGPPHTLGRELPCGGLLPRSRIGPRAVVHERAGQIQSSTVELFSIFFIYIQILVIQKFVYDSFELRKL